MNEPRLVQQSARTAADDEEINVARTAAFLTEASEEQWEKQTYRDEEGRIPFSSLPNTNICIGTRNSSCFSGFTVCAIREKRFQICAHHQFG
jgi:hypothetical protein